MTRQFKSALLIASVVSGCICPPIRSWDKSELTAQLEENRTKWRAAGLRDYQFELDVVCFCSALPAVVSVAAGEVQAAHYVHDGSPVQPADLGQYHTIDGLFDLAEAAMEEDPDFMSVKFDPDLGFPTEIQIDPIACMYDEQTTFLVSDLVPASE